MAGLLVLILIGVAGIGKWAQSNMMQPENQPSGEEMLAESIAVTEAQLADPNIDKEYKKQLKENLAIMEYQLAHNETAISPLSREQHILNSYSMLSLVLMFSVIASAGIVATEFSQGTIKMLLSRPVKRWKILTSKYVTTLLYALVLTFIAITSAVIAGFIFYDAGSGIILDVQDGTVVEVSYWGRVFALYSLQFVGVIVFTTFAFMIGSVFRTSSLAIGLSIFLLFMGPNIVYFLREYEFTKYILFTHIDLTGYINGNMFVQGITWPFSVAVLLMYMLLFLFISYWSFTKRDITA